MQTISATANGILGRGGLTGVSISCVGAGGNITVTQADIIAGSFYIDRNSTSSGNIEIGNAETSELGFILDNHDRRFDSYVFEGAQLVVTQTIGAETLKLGIYTVDQPPKSLSTITIKALDHMARFNRKYATSLTGTPTLLQILQDSCTTCNVVLKTTSFTNSSVACNIPSDLTHHEVVSMVAQAAGCNAWIDEDGQLNLSWYGENQGTTVIEIDSTKRFENGFELDENDIEITGLMFSTADNDYISGTDDYALDITGNVLIDDSNATTILPAIFTKIGGFTYRPYRFNILPSPHFWPLDEIVIVEPETLVETTSVIMRHRFILNGTSRVSAVGDNPTVSGYATFAPFTTAQRTAIAKTTKEVVSVMGLSADWLVAGIISADRIGAGSIDATKLAADSVTADKIAAGAVTAEEIAAGTITAGSAIIEDGAITSAKIGDAQITTAKIANGAITTALIDEAAIGTTQIADGSITDAKIVGLTANKITAGTIDAANINVINLSANNLTVGTLNGQRIGEGTITADKLAESAVTAEKIAVGAITAAHLAQGSITAEKIAAGSIKESQVNWSTHLLF